jgi:murein DD-endopeptidase MepM/ murein hydrolase activator NlpD
MRRLAPIALLLALPLFAGAAQADTFAVVPTISTPLALPSFAVPNAPGTVLMPASLSTPPVSPVQLSYSQLLAVWQRAGSAYGIPWQVLAAINKVESNFGRNMGPSSAGAVGWMQFMPGTWLRWGVDASGDGVADPWNPTDAVFSAARYLAAAGGSTDLYRGVYAYNHADWYVHEVLALADVYGAGSTVAFSLDRMQQSLDAARRETARAGDALLAARRAERHEARVVARWTARAERTALLSDRLTFQQRAGHAAERRDGAGARAASLVHELAAAQSRLAQAQQASATAGFSPGSAQLLSAPSYSAGYVFPVGGGPGVVSASHTHHDYPAVDIAAPLGAPLYALADAVVVRSWSAPDARCGIGLTLQASDGQVWTYCHLSVLDPRVVPGAALRAGQQVGLVGATGDATGPHLHLQLQPATAWPQEEAWFQSFADTAFSWSDVGAATPSTGAPVFRALQGSPPGPARRPVFQVEQTPDPSNEVVYFSS